MALRAAGGDYHIRRGAAGTMIIGLCGAAGAGKGEVAKVLRARFRAVEMAFADPLYEMVSIATGVTPGCLADRAQKEEPIGWVGKSPRELLQTLGTEWGRTCVAEDFWIRHLLRRLDATDQAWLGKATICVTDVRFDNEAKAIRGRGGVIWRVVRDSLSCLTASAAKHESENGISQHLVDAIVSNDGDLTDLDAAVCSLHAAII